MTDINPPRINRRRMLSITATTVAGLAAGALASSGPAHAAPSLCDLPGTGSVGPELCGPLGSGADCGGFNDVTPPGVTDRLFLWERVKNVTPAFPGTNTKVVRTSVSMIPQQPQPVPKVIPPPTPLSGSTKQAYAIRQGGTPGGSGPNNRLLIPTQRLSGIECSHIWQGTTLNFCKIAFDEANAAPRPVGTVPAIGINSKAARQQDQLHIHLSRAQAGVMKNLESALKKNEIKLKQADWGAAPHVTILGRTYRVLHRQNLNDNPFRLMLDNVAPKNMGEQMLAIVPAPQGGFYLINSEVKALPGGTGQVDSLLYYT